MSIHEAYNLDRPVYEPLRTIAVKSHKINLFAAIHRMMKIEEIRENKRIKSDAEWISSNIKCSRTLRHCRTMRSMIEMFSSLRGTTPQVAEWVKTLKAELTIKENEIIKSL